MQVISLMLNRSRCDTTATEVRHFPCRTFRQKTARLFLNVLRQRLSSLRLSDFRLSTKVLPIAVQMVLPMLVSLVHLQNWSLICSVTFLIRCPPYSKAFTTYSIWFYIFILAERSSCFRTERLTNRNMSRLQIIVTTTFKIKSESNWMACGVPLMALRSITACYYSHPSFK